MAAALAMKRTSCKAPPKSLCDDPFPARHFTLCTRDTLPKMSRETSISGQDSESLSTINHSVNAIPATARLSKLSSKLFWFHCWLLC
ncbi:hypothetical protein CEXT_600041 [Caerostris extrusa]|uniref:Uncharacterized protein n=1 Tax=Caerostris extrusa TaxID=172846 RepID=A0AAV4RJ29_CAEEX|nr:hypothetical protein CEXT_600041 [Caerostris extrusa]